MLSRESGNNVPSYVFVCVPFFVAITNVVYVPANTVFGIFDKRGKSSNKRIPVSVIFSSRPSQIFANAMNLNKNQLFLYMCFFLLYFMPDSKHAIAVLEALKKKYGVVKHYIHFSNPLELLVAAILSPQVRDEVVNAATPELFRRYRTAKDYAHASGDDVLKYVSKVSFAGKKAQHIIEACKILDKQYGGVVPRELNKLTELPGIGKKTALVILADAYDIF